MPKPNVSERLRKARTFEKAGNFGQAREIYSDILREYPQNKTAREALGTLGLPKTKGNASATPPRQVLSSLLSLYQSGALKAAVEQTRTALGQYPNSSILWNLLGASYSRLRERKLALAAFQKACKLDPRNADAFNNLGNALAEGKRLDDAARAFETAIDIRHEFFEALSNLAIVYSEQGRLDEAIEKFRKALSFNEAYLPAWNGLGSALEGVGQPEKARNAYLRAIKLDPTYSPVLSNYGTFLSKSGNYDESVVAHKRAIEHAKTDPELRVAYAQTLIRQGDEPAALEQLKIAIRLDAKAKKAYLTAGMLLLEKAEFDKAEALFRMALKLDETDLGTARYLNKALLAQNKFQDAVEVYEGTSFEAGPVKRARIALAKSLVQHKELELAENVIRGVLSKDPEDERAILVLSDVLMELERDDEAIEVLSRGPTSRKKQLNSLYNKADALMKTGQVRAAIDRLHEALEINPKDMLAAQKMAILPRSHLSDHDVAAIERVLGSVDPERPAHKPLSAHYQKHLGNLTEYASQIVDAKWRRPPREELAASQLELLREARKRLEAIRAGQQDEQPLGFGHVLLLGPSTSGKSTIERVLSHNDGFVPRYELANGKALAVPLEELEGLRTQDKTSIFGSLLRIDDIGKFAQGDVFISTSAIMVTIVDRLLALNPATKVVYAKRSFDDLMVDIYRKPYQFRHDYSYRLDTILDYVQEYDLLMSVLREKLGGNYLELRMDRDPIPWDQHVRELASFFGKDVRLPEGDASGLSLFDDRDFYDRMKEIWGIDAYLGRGPTS
ncbi:tetratricopeptide repeat protein [Rhodobacterales bacterium HKCCSP123]|nr:tetratricopeptide repeat protein [Rhodobacterales bacterium HKCCSP123]